MKRLVKLQYNSPVVLTFALGSLGALLLGFATDSRRWWPDWFSGSFSRTRPCWALRELCL